jgi:hypothetical protein
MNNNERKATAYHEAGHAVIGAIHGRLPTSVDIVYDARGNAGHTLFASDLPPEFKRYFNQSPEKQRHIEMRVLITLAGTAAHDILCPGRAHDEGDRRDEHEAFEMIDESRSWAQDNSAYLEVMKIKVCEQLTEHWPKVVQLAEMLLQRNSISGADLAALLARSAMT